MVNLNLYFPEDCQPRNSQTYILNEISAAMRAGEKFIIIQAPTGSGKSHISATMANYSKEPTNTYIDAVNSNNFLQKEGIDGEYSLKYIFDSQPTFGCAVLTTTKALQNQYLTLFKYGRSVKGKRNYICREDSDFRCDIAPCSLLPEIKSKCFSQNKCPHFNALKESLCSKFAIFNYSSYIVLPKHVSRRQILVCDEASELEDHLISHYSCNINYKQINFDDFNMQKLYSDDIINVQGWLTKLKENITTAVNELNKSLAKIKDKIIIQQRIQKTRMYGELIESINNVLNLCTFMEFVVEFDADKVSIMPLHIQSLAQDFFNNCDTVILMSGTIIDVKTFAKTLGIEKYKFIEMESEFDPSKSPIYSCTKFPLSHKTLDKYLPSVIDLALKICENHKQDKGIIHTHNMKITDAFRFKVGKDKRFLIRDAGITNEKILDRHYNTSNSVIISPSLGFGTDLKDENGRFQIITKTPYLPLNTKRIAILAKQDPAWYKMKTIVNLVQMSGRCTRHKDDYSDTYILDANAVDLIKRYASMLPKYFRDRLK